MAKVDEILQLASAQLQDADHIRWPLPELLAWLNEGQCEIVAHKPNAYTFTVAHKLTVGTRQALPPGAVQLINVIRNLPGKSIRITNQDALDAQVPDWHDMQKQPVVQHYCYNPLDPSGFYVYPPNTGSGTVELTYSASPPDAVLGGMIAISDIYRAPLLDYVLYRAWGKDAEYSTGDRATWHHRAFRAAIGIKIQAETGASPNNKHP